MFCDIRSFAAITESLEPLQLVRFLNRYFTVMNEAVFAHGGEIDKLMGDCIMASFTSCDAAVTSGMAFSRNLAAARPEFASLGVPVVDNGIGIAFGPVVAGNIGSGDKLDFTLIGDVVNVASRIEALTRTYGVACLVTDEVHHRLTVDYAVRFVDRVRVKGKNEPLDIYEVFARDTAPLPAAKMVSASRLKELFGLYCGFKLNEALAGYRGLLAEHPALGQDPLIGFLARRCAEMLVRGERGIIEAGTWDGVFSQTAK
jgi:class 3 adenylate cyclase